MKSITDLDDSCVWHKTAQPAPNIDRLDEDVTTKMAIVGGGFTGLATALRLGEQGCESVVLEARQIGFGASGRNLGHCTPTLHFWPYDKIRKIYGDDYGRRIMDMQTGAAKQVFSLIESYQIKCEAVYNGILRVAASPRHLAGLAAQNTMYEKFGLEGQILSVEEAADLSGSPRFHGGWLMQGAGHLNPLGYARGLARAALSRGSKLYVDSPVTGIVRDGPKWRVNTPGGTVLADKILLATGAYTVEGPWPKLSTAVDNVPIVGLATGPLDPRHRETVLKHDHSIVDTHGDPILYKWTSDNRLITTVFFSGRMASDPAATKDYMSRKTEWVFPQLGRVEWKHYWYGLLDGQYRTVPRLFRLEDNVYACMGYSGRGVPTATAMGTELADLLVGKDPEKLSVPIEKFQPVMPGLARLQALQMQWTRIRDRWRLRLDGVRDLPPTI